MVKGGWKHENIDECEYSFRYKNQEAQDEIQTVPLRELMHAKYLKYIVHLCGHENNSIKKGRYLQRLQRNTFGIHG